MKKILLILIYSCFMRFFLKVVVGIQFRNREVLKKHSQFILIANHNSHLDAVTLLAAIPSDIIHKVHPAAASDYFGNSKAKAFFSRTFINALLIPRSKAKDGGGTDPIDCMTELLEAGHSLILFPEGTRGEPEVMQRFRRGIGILLERFPTVAVLPVYLEGLGKCLPKGDSLLVPFTSTATFGDPHTIQGDTPEEIALHLEKRTANLKNEFQQVSLSKADPSRKEPLQETSFINAIHFVQRLRKSTNSNQHLTN